MAAVRELLSTAIDRSDVTGRVVNNATEATSPSDATARSGTMRYSAFCRYSMEGISARSAEPS